MDLPIEQIEDFVYRIAKNPRAIFDKDIHAFINKNANMLIDSKFIHFYIKACKDDYTSRTLLQKQKE